MSAKHFVNILLSKTNKVILVLFNVVFLLGVKLRQQRELLEPVAQEEDREEEISGAQFLCETVIRSLTLEEAPDHRPLRRAQHSSHKPQGEEPLPPCVVLYYYQNHQTE